MLRNAYTRNFLRFKKNKYVLKSIENAKTYYNYVVQYAQASNRHRIYLISIWCKLVNFYIPFSTKYRGRQAIHLLNSFRFVVFFLYYYYSIWYNTAIETMYKHKTAQTEKERRPASPYSYIIYTLYATGIYRRLSGTNTCWGGRFKRVLN